MTTNAIIVSPAVDSLLAQINRVPRQPVNAWRLYEAYKQRIAAIAQTPEEYEDAIHELARVLGL